MKHDIDEEMATTMARAEERALLDRSQTQAGYTSAMAGAVRGIREKKFALPSSTTAPDEPLLTVTERMSKKNDVALLSERQFYEALASRYLLTPEQLRENGYPIIVKNAETNQRMVVIESSRGDSKTFSDDSGTFALP